jgi:hypothetical protein
VVRIPIERAIELLAQRAAQAAPRPEGGAGMAIQAPPREEGDGR